MTSIVGITALQEIRKFKGFETAVIAGGFVRDSLMGGSVKDLDIFIPCQNQDDFKRTVEQHFPRESVGKDEIQMFKVTDKDFDGWEQENRKKGIDIWREYSFERDHEYQSYIVTPQNVKKEKIIPEIGNFKSFVFNRNGYRQISPNYIGRYDCRYMDFLDVDIVGYHVGQVIKDFEGNVINDFAEKLISEFSYNIDKVYYDGETIQSKEFQSDFRNRTATLTKLDSLEGLPHAMRKFERLREKYPDIIFKSTVLEVKEKDKSDRRDQEEEYKSKYYDPRTNPFTFINNGLQPAGRPWR